MQEPRVETSDPEFSWGIPLTKRVKATSLSLLAEPNTDDAKTPRRAVVFVSSTNMDTCEMDYAVFRLQLTKRQDLDSAPLVETYDERKPYSVLTQASVHGTLRNRARSIGPISSVFLAGASFRFHLDQEGE
jgi:hypothetical protein